LQSRKLEGATQWGSGLVSRRRGLIQAYAGKTRRGGGRKGGGGGRGKKVGKPGRLGGLKERRDTVKGSGRVRQDHPKTEGTPSSRGGGL